MREFLLAGLGYDLWANRAWLSMLHQMPDAGPVMGALIHVVDAQRIWAVRCGAGELAATESLEHSLKLAHAAWIGIVEDGDLDSVIEYRNLKGVEHARPLGEIAWHVVNHGTYHRGHMRALAEAQGAAWPETDLVLYFDEMRGLRRQG